jgi:tetratricopeptide (TPR) repeat protein
VNSVIESGIRNCFSLDFLSATHLNYFHSAAQAKAYADAFIERYPDVITGYYDKGRALEAENRPEEAVAEYMRALDSPIRCDYYLAETDERLALAHQALGKKDLAAGYAAKALDIHRQYWIPDRLNDRIRKLEKIKNMEGD